MGCPGAGDLVLSPSIQPQVAPEALGRVPMLKALILPLSLGTGLRYHGSGVRELSSRPPLLPT